MTVRFGAKEGLGSSTRKYGSGFDVCIQANGHGLAIHQGSGDCIPTSTRYHQGTGGRSRSGGRSWGRGWA